MLFFFSFINAIIYNCKGLRSLRFNFSSHDNDLWYYCKSSILYCSAIQCMAKKGAEDVVLKCPLLQNSHYRNDTSGIITVQLALCCIKCSPKWTRSFAFETNSHSLCSTWVEDINAYLCGLGLATLLGNRIFYTLKQKLILLIFWWSKYAWHSAVYASSFKHGDVNDINIRSNGTCYTIILHCCIIYNIFQQQLYNLKTLQT